MEISYSFKNGNMLMINAMESSTWTQRQEISRKDMTRFLKIGLTKSLTNLGFLVARKITFPGTTGTALHILAELVLSETR